MITRVAARRAAWGAAFPADELQDADLEAKATETLIAKLALAGHTVHAGRAGDFMVTRRGISRHCQDFDSLQAFARQLGVL
jgi:hypothetical protein